MVGESVGIVGERPHNARFRLLVNRLMSHYRNPGSLNMLQRQHERAFAYFGGDESLIFELLIGL